MADITCPVCGTVNPSTRTFCLKCASDLHAPVQDATTVMPTPTAKATVPIQPILIGGGLALAAVALIAVLAMLLGGTPAATTVPSTLATGSPATATDGPSPSATDGPTEPPATPTPEPTSAPTPEPTPTPVPKPTILSFTGPDSVDCSDPAYNGFITLTWEVDFADSTELSIDGPGIYKAYPGTFGTDNVPFGCGAGEHRYTLTTVGGNGKAATKTLTIPEVSSS